jgi:hypothetical protein
MECLRFAKSQAAREWILLKRDWLILLACVCMQWVHLVATNVAYYMHVPGEPLPDLGFAVLPALTPYQQIASECMFWFILASTIFFALTPFFVGHARPMYTMHMLCRFLSVCFASQTLRIICFLSTALPSPNYHCRPLAPDYNPPRTLWTILNPMEKDMYKGCGDLVFSSHTIFVMLCVMTWIKYAPWLPKKYPIALSLFFALLVVMARKHYTLDVVVALYTVPLLWLAYEQIRPDTVPLELSSLSGCGSAQCSPCGSPTNGAFDSVHAHGDHAHGSVSVSVSGGDCIEMDVERGLLEQEPLTGGGNASSAD